MRPPAFASGGHLVFAAMLLGRDRELERIDAVLHGARSGASATLALVGEPGIGKTVLLEAAADRARDMTVLRVTGVESEAEIAFASLFALLRPVLDLLGEIPEPQAIALESALALRPAAGQERFAVGAATLSLLAAAAERSPLLVLIDDTQWLDRSSAQALLFAFRRLIAERVAVVMTVRAGEASLVDGTDLPVMTLDGLSAGEAAVLLEGLEPDTVGRLHRTTGGNPLALLELAKDPGDVALAPADAPLLVSERIGRAFAGRLSGLDEAERRAVSLAAASDNGELGILAAAAAELGVDLSRLSGAEAAGLVTVRAGNVEFSHPLARSAVYAATPAGERRAAHQALAGALPDRDIDSRAWHFAAAAIGSDEVAAAAVEQAGVRSRDRGAYASAAAAFERAARLTAEPERRARLLADAAEACWQAGSADRSLALLDECAAVATEPATVLDVEELRGRIATRQGPVMRGCEILSQAAAAATGERAVTLLAEATSAALYAGRPREMMALAARARAAVPVPASPRAQFLAAAASGMAEVVGGDAASGTQALHEAIGIVDESETIEDLRLLPWLVLAPIFLREAESGRSLIERAVASARERAAVSTLPFVLNLIARDDATTDRWVAAEAAYREAIELARENDQRTDLAFGLSGLAWLVARRGEELECRALAAEALELCASLGTALHAIWVTAALGELELALGDAASAVERFEDQRRLLRERGITDPDLSPAPELVRGLPAAPARRGGTDRRR